VTSVALGAWTRSSAGPPVVQSAQVAGTGTTEVQPDPTAVRSRYVTINFSGLPVTRPRNTSLREPVLPLELFPDVSVIAVFDRFDENATGVTWVGHVEDVPMSTVTLVYGDGLMVGSISMPGGAYSIRPAGADVRLAYPQPGGGQLHLVTEINQAGFPREAPPVEVGLSPAERAKAASDPMADNAEFVDLMILYTPTVVASVGGLATLNNMINLAVSETNTSYANSAITHRIRLTNTAQVNYTETSSFSTSLNSLRVGTGAFSGVPALRDANRADLVTLLVHPTSPDACGIGYLMTSVSTAFAPSGFNVVDSSCLSISTLAHEIGHNMGARHDWYVDSGTTPFTYAHGYVSTAAGQRWRTIMSYNDRCSDQGFNCARVLYWANPDKIYLPFCDRGFGCAQLQYWFFQGLPMGTRGGTNTSCRVGSATDPSCDADDHLTLNNTALTTANFRQITTSLTSRGDTRSR
jgi:hypothetical protein